MDEQKQDDQQESKYNSSVPVQDAAYEIYRKLWSIEKGGGEGQVYPYW